MFRRCLLWLILATASVMLVAGCKSVRESNQMAREERESLRRAEAHAHYAAGVLHDLNDELLLALGEYYQAAWLDPGDETLMLEVTRRFLINKQPDKALELLSRAVKLPDVPASFFARLAIVYSQLGRPELAINAGRTAISKDPQSLVGYQNLFAALLQNKRPEEALAVLDEAAALRDKDADFLTGLTELYLNLGMQASSLRTNTDAKAHDVLLRAQKLAPNEPDMQLRLADDFNMLRDSDRAAEMYQALLKNLPKDSRLRERIRARLVEIYMRGQDQNRAYEQLQAIAKNDPANARVYYALGSLAFDGQDMTNAAEYFSKTILLRPDIEPAYYDLASAQLNLNEPLTAMTTLAKARGRFADSFSLEYLSGVAATQITNYSDALKYFTTAEIIGEASEPQRLTGEFYFQIGATCERLGKIEEANKYFEKTLSLQPDNDEAMNYLGFMWADHGTNLVRARELIEKALAREPTNSAYLDSMGWVLFKLDEPKEALAYMLKALDASETPDAESLDHLGDIYARLNQMEKARDAWRRSVEIEPNEQVQKKLAPD